MSKRPINLAVRFGLEVGAIITYGIWGLMLSDSWTRFLLMIILPLIFALIWGIFAVPDDPSRSGKTVVKTPGLIRLIIELALFGIAILMLSNLGYVILGWVFGAVVLFHYVISYDRIGWLLKQK